MRVQVQGGGVGHGGVEDAAVGERDNSTGETGSLLRVVDPFERGSEVLVGGVGIVVVDGVADGQGWLRPIALIGTSFSASASSCRAGVSEARMVPTSRDVLQSGQAPSASLSGPPTTTGIDRRGWNHQMAEACSKHRYCGYWRRRRL